VATLSLVFPEAQFPILKKLLLSTCDLFDYQQELCFASFSLVQSQLSLAVFHEFLTGLERHEDIQPTHETAASFSLPANEFWIPRGFSMKSILNQFLLLRNGFSIWRQ
jgi:hypothetical protein